MNENIFKLASSAKELERTLPQEVAEGLDHELGAIMHDPDFRCYEIYVGWTLEQSRFVGFDIEGAGCLIELRNVERDCWTITVKVEGEA